MTARTATCTLCHQTVEADEYSGAWIDPDTQDSQNEGLRCPGNDDGPHEVDTTPDCTSCGDRVNGCPRCTDAHGDTR
jgi:hypothetical protein